MLRLAVFLVSLVVSTSFTAGLETRPCSNGRPQPSLVMIAGCCEMPCNVRRGTDEPLLIQFDSPFNSKTLRYQKIVTLFGSTTEYLLPGGLNNTCDFLSGASCPIAQGQRITTTFSYPIVPVFPLAIVYNELSVIDEEGRTVTCFQYDTQIIPA